MHECSRPIRVQPRMHQGDCASVDRASMPVSSVRGRPAVACGAKGCRVDPPGGGVAGTRSCLIDELRMVPGSPSPTQCGLGDVIEVTHPGHRGTRFRPSSAASRLSRFAPGALDGWTGA
jgi:hypothetical protein